MNETKHPWKVVCELKRTERMHKAVVDSRISALGIHRNQHSVLREIECVEKIPGAKPLSQKDLAEKFGISAAAVAMMMKKMEQDGYIKRVMSQSDNRYNELYLTEYGQDILNRTRNIFCDINAATYAGLTDDEIELMIRCLQKMQENLCALPELEGVTDVPKNEFRKKG